MGRETLYSEDALASFQRRRRSLRYYKTLGCPGCVVSVDGLLLVRRVSPKIVKVTNNQTNTTWIGFQLRLLLT